MSNIVLLGNIATMGQNLIDGGPDDLTQDDKDILAGYVAGLSAQDGWDLTQGQGNHVEGGGITAGQNCTARNGAIAFGLGCEANGGISSGRFCKSIGNDSMTFGVDVTATGDNGGGTGWQNMGTADRGWVEGCGAADRGTEGARAYASGGFNPDFGSSQRRELVLHATTIGAETKRMTSAQDDTVSFKTALNIPDNSVCRISGCTLVKDITTKRNDSLAWVIRLSRALGPSTLTIEGMRITPDFPDQTRIGVFALLIDINWGLLVQNCTGEDGKTIQWNSRIISLENTEQSSE